MKKTIVDRFFDKVNKTDTCWLWTAATHHNGYGQFVFDGRPRPAHRFSYIHHFGKIPEGLVIDHLCRVRNCVNPNHLEAVTFSENTKRGISSSRQKYLNTFKTHCKRGHEFSETNTHINANGARVCKECGRIRDREKYERRKRFNQTVPDGLNQRDKK